MKPRAADGRRLGAFLLVAVLACALLSAVRHTIPAGDGLVARYFDNPDATGAPFYSVIDRVPSSAQIQRRWGDVSRSAFSIVWTGYLTVASSGTYAFATTSDDGSRLYIDGQLVVDNGGRHSAETRSGQLLLSRGPHTVRLDYVQFGGDAELTWSWARGDGRYGPVPAWVLSQRRAQYGAVIAARFVDLLWWSIAALAGIAVGWSVRRNWRGAASAAAAAAVVAAAVPFDPIVSTNFYEYLVHVGFVRRLQWGADVVATYGPWGFVAVPLYHPATIKVMLIVNALILAVTAVRVVVLIRRTQPPGASLPGLWAIAVFLPLTIVPVAEWSAALFCFPIIASTIAVEWIAGRRRSFGGVDAVSTVTLGFLTLVKLSTWPIALVLVVASWFQPRRYAFAMTTSFLLGATGGWLAAGQSLLNLGAFMRLGFEVIAGYKNGMSLWGSSDLAAVFFVGAPLVPIAALLVRFPPRGVSRWMAYVVLAVVLTGLFQSAFVRSGTHHIISNGLATCALIPLLFAGVLADRKRVPVLPAVAITTSAIVVVMLFRAAPRSPYYQRPQAELRGLLSLAADGLSSLEFRRARSLSRLRAGFPLTDKETTGTGAIFSGDFGILEANGARFSLEPTVTSYAAYTRRLEELNTRWLQRISVDWALWCGPPAVDLRYPTEVDGRAVAYLATHFEFQRQVGHCALLRRGAASEWHAERTDVRQVAFDQTVPVDAPDGSIVWAEISVRETFVGRVMRTFFKPAPVRLYAVQKNGTTFVQDVVPAITREGFLLSPVVDSWRPLSEVAAGHGSDRQVVGVSVGLQPLGFPPERLYRPEVTISTTILRSSRRD